MPDSSDMELVRDYVRLNSEAAFAELVQRHIALVYSAALRHAGIAAHAEEITQAVFIILARKAARLRPDTVLEGWLHETTRLTALSFLRGERRRQFREQEAYMQSTLQESAEASAWNQLAPLLDEAVSRLGKKDRDAVMLRFFKEKSVREVAMALQVNEPAAQRRVHRAVEKLRRFFTKRGIALSAAVITGAISANSVQAAPVALAKSVTAVAIVKGATAGGSTLTLIKGALKIMAWTKAKTAVVTGVVLILAAGTTTVIIKHAGQSSPLKSQTNPAVTAESFKQESFMRLDQSKQWALAFIMYADKHQNQLPQNFEQVKSYNPKLNLSDSNWEIVTSGNWKNISNPSLTILLREKEARQSPDGTFVKAYTFADGHSQLVSSPTADFTEVEKKWGFLARPAKN